MKLPFEKGKIYITLDDNTLFELHADFSKTEVDKSVVLTREWITKQPTWVLHKSQFEYLKEQQLDKSSPNALSNEAAETYVKMGFLTEEEYQRYIN